MPCRIMNGVCCRTSSINGGHEASAVPHLQAGPTLRIVAMKTTPGRRMIFRGSQSGLPRRAVAAISGVVFFATGCVVHGWTATPITELGGKQTQYRLRAVRFTTDSGQVSMAAQAIALPYVSGQVIRGDGPVEFDVRNAESVEVVALNADGSMQRVLATASLKDSTSFLGKSVRFRTGLDAYGGRGSLVFRNVASMEGTWVRGRLVSGSGMDIRFDTRRAKSAEVQSVDGVGTVMASLGVVVGLVAVVVLIVALTKSSCPFVYVDTGHGYEFIGEAYPGAAFRSTKRDDLLPIPAGDSGTMRVQLRNEALETQYTDRAELVLVDHAPGVRALSTFDGRPILVHSAVPPVNARDTRAGDVTGLVQARDQRPWVTDVDKIATIDEARLADEVTATFAAPVSGKPVLELVAGNTPWLDLVFGRFFAAMGGHLPDYLAQGADSAAGPRINQWRDREGVDLTVEMKNATGWQRVAIVPTVGPATLREVAIPLPVTRTAGDTVVVRVRGGLGFWRIDQMALSIQSDAAPVAQHVPAHAAIGTGGRDELSTIAATDGRSNTLTDMNERLDIEFQLPPLAAGQTRSAFLFSNGYYNVHRPLQAQWLPLTLKTIRDEPGALSRFGRDLAREYAKAMAATPARAGAIRQ